MKILTYFFWTLLSFFFMSSSCKKENVNLAPVLPAITQTGAETFGCLINGQVYIPKATFPHPTIRISVQNDVLHVVADKAATGEAVLFFIENFKGIGEYDLSLINAAQYILGIDSFQATGGSLIINRYDSNIVSGTFSFYVKESTGKLIKIENGRFDLDLTK